MVKRALILAILFIFADAKKAAANTSKIVNYHALFRPCLDLYNNHLVAIRTYQSNNVTYLLLVDPITLKIQVSRQTDIKCGLSFPSELRQTLYAEAIYRYSSPPYPMVNAGLNQSRCPVQGMSLTIDMCPSHKPLEKKFFETLVRLADEHHPIPIAISISGLWILHHPQEFDWLVSLARGKKLTITWVNHSFSHRFNAHLSLKNNFMLTHPEQFDREVLKTEELLLEKNQLPSVFFRFPGLVSNKTLVLQLKNLGLIPVGANAWLAKGQKAVDGSIVLVHGNSNEPQGIAIISKLLKAHEKWLPLIQMLTGSCRP